MRFDDDANFDYYERYQPRNREKVLAPKPGVSWCWGCDANLVSSGEKCDVCGHIEPISGNKKKRRRKLTGNERRNYE